MIARPPPVTPLTKAYDYAQLGLAVVPLCGPRHKGCPHPGKIPFDLLAQRHMSGWQRRGVPTPEEIDAWLTRPLAQRANIGCLTGRPSRIIGLDVDGVGGERLLAEASGGRVPETWEYRSGGGRRLVFRYPDGVTIPSTKQPDEGEHQELAVLSDGRQMVLPPSVHSSGKVYEWVPGRNPWQFGEPAPAPDWLIEFSRKSSGKAADGSKPSVPPDEWVRLILEGCAEGSRNDSAARLAGYLLRRDLPPPVVAALLLRWNEKNRPPLPESEILTVVASVARAEAARRGGRIA